MGLLTRRNWIALTSAVVYMRPRSYVCECSMLTDKAAWFLCSLALPPSWYLPPSSLCVLQLQEQLHLLITWTCQAGWVGGRGSVYNLISFMFVVYLIHVVVYTSCMYFLKPHDIVCTYTRTCVLHLYIFSCHDALFEVVKVCGGLGLTSCNGIWENGTFIILIFSSCHHSKD